MNTQNPFFHYYPQQANPRLQSYYSGSPFSQLPSVWPHNSYQTAAFPSTYTFLQSTSVVGRPMQYSEVISKTKGCTAEEGEGSPIVDKITREFFSEEDLTDFQKKLNKFIVSGVGKFVDIDFPPNFKSLVGENAAKKQDWVNYCWLRPEEFMDYTRPILPIVGKIEPNDIRQGKLNDATLLSSLASIAEHPHRIKKILNFEFPEKSEEEVIALCKKHGIYCVRIFDMGVPVEVVIDDIFPCAPLENLTTAFTRTLENEMWSLLIEKAWAKSYNSYADIDWGYARHSLFDFTGAPTKVVWCDEDHLWPTILKGEAKNWIMTTGANPAVEKEDVTAEGIVTNQSYSLLAGIEFEDKESGGLVKLVKLRDPHGTREWKGKWSDDSKEFERIPTKYTEEGRNKNDGIFFMDFEDFKKNFVNVQFCIVDDDFKYSYVVSKVSKKQGTCFRVKITKKGRYFFAVLQKHEKKYSRKIQDDDFDYSRATMVVAKKTAENYQYVCGAFQKQYEMCNLSKENEEIDVGEYLVWVKCQLKYSEEDKFTLSVYGSDSVEISQIKKEKDFLEKVYLDYSKQCKNVKKVEGVEGCEIRDEITKDGYAFVAVRNGNKEKKVNCEIRFINLKENLLKVKGKPHEEVKKFSLDPNSEKILLLRMEWHKEAKTQFYEAHIVAEN